MKTLILTTALVVLSAVSFAQNDTASVPEIKSDLSKVKVAMYSNVTDLVTLIIVKEPEVKLNLKIKDESGSLVYAKSLKKPENRKITFDITSLPEGKYTFELAKGKEVYYSNFISKGATSIAFSK